MMEKVTAGHRILSTAFGGRYPNRIFVGGSFSFAVKIALIAAASFYPGTAWVQLDERINIWLLVGAIPGLLLIPTILGRGVARESVVQQARTLSTLLDEG